jgi:hypothetical protein
MKLPDKNRSKYLINTCLFVCITGIVLIGLLMGLVLGEGPAVKAESKYFLSLHRHDWGKIHIYLSLAFIILLAVHLWLNRNWIKCQARQIFKKSWGVALILTAVASILVLFFFWSFYPRQSSAYIGFGYGTGQNTYSQQGIISEDDSIIYGQMTLRRIEQASGHPATDIIEALGLSPEVPMDETLGQLRKIYPFTLQQVRRVLAELEKKKSKQTQELNKIEDLKESLSENMEAAKAESTETIQSEHHEPEEPKLVRGLQADDQSGILITGQMTLYDLEKATGLPAREIANTLGFPENTSLDEQLGRLRKRYGFTLQEVRSRVSSLLKNKD